MQNSAWRTEASLRLLIKMPGLFRKLRQGLRMYLVGSDSEGSGAGAVQKGGWTHGQRSSGLHRQAKKACKKGKHKKA
jgi:hypothetical protein